MKELVQVFDGGRALAMAKVSWSSSGEEVVRALERSGRECNPTFQLTDGPIVDTDSDISRVKIPKELRRDGDSGLCLVFGIGSVMYFSNPPSQDTSAQNGVSETR